MKWKFYYGPEDEDENVNQSGDENADDDSWFHDSSCVGR